MKAWLKKTGYLALVLALFMTQPVLAAGDGVMGVLHRPWVLTLLVIIGLVGLVVELFTPGISFGALISTLAFALFFVGSIGNNMSSVLSLVVFVLGILLLIVELFIPGFGLPGIAGVTGLVAGIAMGFNSLVAAAWTLALGMLVAGSLAFFLIKRGYRSTYLERVILRDQTSSEEGYVSKDTGGIQEGMEGVTLSPLRPSGFVDFDGARKDVMAEGSFIEKGKKVIVSRTSGGEIYVKEL